MPNASYNAAKDLLDKPSALQKMMLRIISVQDSAHGVGTIKFWQHLATILGPKLIVSRSVAEAGESTFLEVAEAGLIYHAAPFLAQRFFVPWMSEVAGKGLTANHLTQSMYDGGKLTQTFAKDAALVKKVLPARAAMLISAFAATGIAGEYALTFMKNLFTQKVFQKSSFTDIANLSQCASNPLQAQMVSDKAHRRIGQCMAAAAGLIGGSLALARWGRNRKWVLTLCEKLVKTFDFEVCSKNKLALSRNFFYPLLATSFVAYIDASRDRLEKLENALRLTVTMTSLAFGNEAIQKAMVSWMKDGRAQKVLGKDNKVLPLQSLVDKAGKSPAAFKELFAAKSVLAGFPLLFAVAIPGLGVGILNRILTANRYDRAQKQQMNSREQPVVQHSQTSVARPSLPKPVTGPVMPFAPNWPRPNYYATWTTPMPYNTMGYWM